MTIRSLYLSPPKRLVPIQTYLFLLIYSISYTPSLLFISLKFSFLVAKPHPPSRHSLNPLNLFLRLLNLSLQPLHKPLILVISLPCTPRLPQSTYLLHLFSWLIYFHCPTLLCRLINCNGGFWWYGWLGGLSTDGRCRWLIDICFNRWVIVWVCSGNGFDGFDGDYVVCPFSSSCFSGRCWRGRRWRWIINPLDLTNFSATM